MKEQHTPGPWDYDAHGIKVGGTGGAAGCRLVEDPCITEPNARLLAAAPELRENLERAVAILENVLLHQGRHMTSGDLHGREQALAEFRATLAKARGK